MDDDDMPEMINPALSCMYQWTWEQDAQYVQVKIPLPERSFNTEAVQVSLSEDKNAISAKIARQIPILEGTLFANVKSFSMEPSSDSINITLEKEEPGEWPLVVASPVPSTNDIDPKSAFGLFSIWTNSNSPEHRELSMHFMERAVSVGYSPALLLAFHASLHGSRESRDRGMALLMIAANHYEDPIAMLTLGNQLAMKEETRDDAFDLYGRAVSQGTILGLSMMGQLVSPLSDIPFHHKNGEQAVALFERILEKFHEPIAMSELAKLLFNGIGVKKDIRRAEMLHAGALENLPELPELIEVDPKTLKAKKKKKHSPFLSLYQACAIAAFGCAGLYVFYRIWKSRWRSVPIVVQPVQ